MLKALLGNRTIERILFFLLTNDKTYATEISKRFNCGLTTVQHGLDRLEDGGIIVSFTIGRVRLYQFNPRYPFLPELKALLAKAYQAIPEHMKVTLYEPPIRRRPRKRGKPLLLKTKISTYTKSNIGPKRKVMQNSIRHSRGA